MALRASGRSSHSVATLASSLLDAQDRRLETRRSLPCPQANRLVGTPVWATRVHGPHCAHSHRKRIDPAHLQRRGVREPGRTRLAPPRRAAGFEAFASTPLPSESEEVWRYSPIDELALDDFAPAVDGSADGGARRATELLESRSTPRWARRPPASSCTTDVPAPSPDRRRGRRRTVRLRPGRRGGRVRRHARVGPAGRRRPGAPERRLHARCGLRRRARRPDGGRPVLVVHWCDAGVAGLPAHLRARRRGRRASRWSRCSPGPTARPAPSSCRSPSWRPPTARRSRTCRCRSCPTPPGRSPAWPARGGGASSLRTFTVGLGGAYDRVRTDVTVDGRDARSEILSTYLGDGTQVHDIRTLQDHVGAADHERAAVPGRGRRARRARSTAASSGSHRGAVRSDARQTNHNLVLDEGAHADSVPEPRHPRERREVLPRLDGGAGRRGPALLHRVPRRGARGGRGAHRAGVLRRHHRPRARCPRCVPLLEREVHDAPRCRAGRTAGARRCLRP